MANIALHESRLHLVDPFHAIVGFAALAMTTWVQYMHGYSGGGFVFYHL